MTGLRRKRTLLFALLILIALAASSALASCGSDSSGTTASAPATTTVPPAVSTTPAATATVPAVTTPTTSSVPPAPQSVNIANYAFSPADISVPQGTTVQWTNGASAPHTITADGGQFNSGNIAPGQSFSFKFDQAGTYAYHCSIHASMTGSITVT